MKRKTDPFVAEAGRRKTPRPQPPHSDRRTKRLKTRNAREREALKREQS